MSTMDKYYDKNHYFTSSNWGKWGDDDEKGVLNDLTPDQVLKAISLVKKGKIYDLETERFHGMPIWDGHCGFEILSYANPMGRRNMKGSGKYDKAYSWNDDGGMLGKDKDAYHMGCNSELMIAPLHSGTHIDALCHWTTGKDDHFYNGYSCPNYMCNFGPLKCDVAQNPPMVMRGVLLDIAGYKGLPHLKPNYIITPEDCKACAEWEGITLQKGDAILLRTGEKWPDSSNCPNAGLGLPAARYLVEECGAYIIGDDMSCLDGFHADGSSSVPMHPQPVHHYLLIQMGIHIMEYLQLDKLAADKEYEVCFICTPAKVRSATAMFIRPIAIV